MIRVLSGPMAGQSFALQAGANTIGRAPSCNITLSLSSISKEHAKIEIIGDKIILSDLGSRNGTFVNGVQIKSRSLRLNEVFSLHDNIMHVTEMPVAIAPQPPRATNPVSASPQGHWQQDLQQSSAIAASPASVQDPLQSWGDPAAADQPWDMTSAQPAASAQPVQIRLESDSLLGGFFAVFKNYIETVMLPGIYKLASWMELHWVLALLMAAFVLAVTALSAIPLVRILKSSLESESQRRALSIADALARENQYALRNNNTTLVVVDNAQKEEGVSDAFIMNANKKIIAPAERAQQSPDGDKVSFVYSAFQQDQKVVAQLDDETIGALVPIKFFNPLTGQNDAQYFAVVVYNMGAIAINDGRTLSLLIQTFFIALIIGSILTYFLYKLVQHPFIELNRQINTALKDQSDQIHIDYQLPELHSLKDNISNLLSRLWSGDLDGKIANSQEVDRSAEQAHLLEIIGFPAIIIAAADRRMVGCNAAFTDLTSISAQQMSQAPLDTLTDQALKLSLIDLIENLELNPHQAHSNSLEFSGTDYDLMAQSIMGRDKPAYYIIAILPKANEYREIG